jgi:hypothetical protein
MASVGDVLRALEEENPERQAELARSADATINELTARIASEQHSKEAPSAVESILLSLHRMVRVATPGRPEAAPATAPSS